MSDQESRPYDQLPGEPPLWYGRFTKYRLMVLDRSVAAVFQQEESEKNREKPREKPTGDWYEMAKEWRWVERAAAWDNDLCAVLEQDIIREKKIVLLTGYAQMHRRVAELDKQVKKLISQAQGEEEFNPNLVKEIREYLTDIAEETGGRVKRAETTIKAHKEYIGDPDDDGVEP